MLEFAAKIKFEQVEETVSKKAGREEQLLAHVPIQLYQPVFLLRARAS